jgi:porin
LKGSVISWSAGEIGGASTVTIAELIGEAAGPGPNDPQQRHRYGINFRINDPPLVLGELQYAWNNKKGDSNLAGTFKVGGGGISEASMISASRSEAFPLQIH